jgi:hypothetical protein
MNTALLTHGANRYAKKNFKLEEEENTALLLHLPKLVAETVVFCSAFGLGCRLVVATVQVSP